MFPPPLLVVPAEPEVVDGSLPVPVDVSVVAPVEAAVSPPAPPTPVLWVSLPDAQAAKAAGVNRAKTTKVMLACFTGL